MTRDQAKAKVLPILTDWRRRHNPSWPSDWRMADGKRPLHWFEWMGIVLSTGITAALTASTIAIAPMKWNSWTPVVIVAVASIYAAIRQYRETRQ